MLLLADESADFAIVRALREAGHDVVAVSEISPRADDRDIIDRCHGEGRILLTEDKDFGQLVYASGAQATGVILLRFPAGRRAEMTESVVNLVAAHADKLAGRFVVLQPGRARMTRLP